MSNANPNEDWAEPVQPSALPPQNYPAGQIPLPPVQGEPTPGVEEPRYGQYAADGAPQYGANYGPAYGMPPAPPVYSVPRPGVIPLRPLNLGDILAGAFNAVRANPAAMIGLPLLITAIAAILGALLGRLFAPGVDNWFQNLVTTGGANDFWYPGDMNLAPTFGVGLTSLFAGPIITGLLTTAISQSILGNKLSVREVWDRARPRIGTLIAWTLLSTLALGVLAFLLALLVAALAIGAGVATTDGLGALIAIPLVFALIGGFIWLVTKLIFVPVIIVLENASIGEAIRRSWTLSRGMFWRILGIYLLSTFLIGTLTSIIGTPLGLLSVAGGGAGFVFSILSSLITTTLSSIFMAGVLSLLYVDARMRKEGLGQTLAAAAQNVGGL